MGSPRLGALLLLATLSGSDVAPGTILTRASMPDSVPVQANTAAAYGTAMLRCAAFRETVATVVRSQDGGAPSEEQGGRVGVLHVAGADSAGVIAFEAWYDTLDVWHDFPSGRAAPETDGLVGGRWVGTIARHGAVRLTTRPFMPPALAQVSDLSDVLLDFFPPLPTIALAPGGRWTDSLGLSIERIADSAAGSGDEALARYRWRVRSRSVEAVQDTTGRLTQTAEDLGAMAWHPTRGPLGWSREIVITTHVAAGRGVRPWRGEVRQRVHVQRTERSCGREG